MGHFRILGRVLAGLTLATAAFGVQAGFSAPPSEPSTVVTIDPARILDTRLAVGVPGTTPVPAQGTIDVQVTGAGGVPATATGVIVTLTGTQATNATFITAFPTGTPRSTTSVLNVSPSVDIANTVTMSIGAGGKISLFNNSGSVHLVADVTGYLLPPGSVTPTVHTSTINLAAYGAAGNNLPVNSAQVNGCINLGTAGEAFLDVPLPEGSVISKVDFRYFDDSQGDIVFLLQEIDFGPTGIPNSNGTLLNSQAQSSGAGGYGVATITPTGSDKASSTVRYMIDAFNLAGPTPGATHSFCGATITYQYLA